ncbi:hypothetical protein PNP85_07965 [Halobacterium salinarum]|uniref:hypothetical protein n=2 Tax=Halobacterium TaxID=2239 RepID=UPI002553142B|nr:hypothetical protein [Halobacterium salinarum]MDL0139437.1 hypothetical protein [Halobacterium salinarum]
MDSRRLALVILLVLAGCQQGPDHNYPEEPHAVHLGASIEESTPANVTVVNWNETSLSANETVQSVVETAVKTNATDETISLEMYRSLRDQFRELPHQITQSDYVTEPTVSVYVRHNTTIIQIQLEPIIYG